MFITTDNPLIWYVSTMFVFAWVALFIPLLPSDEIVDTKIIHTKAKHTKAKHAKKAPLLIIAKQEFVQVRMALKQSLLMVFVALSRYFCWHNFFIILDSHQ